jgi:hypothetical protein
MGLDIEEPNALELDSMEPDEEPDASKLDSMEFDTGPEVLCQNLLVLAPLSWPLLSKP